MPVAPDRPTVSNGLADLADECLAALVRAGDLAAFDTLYLRHHAGLLAFCRRMLHSREDGEDALQQTFLRAYCAFHAGRVPAAVRPWLFVIARNRCCSLLAARRGNAGVPVHELEIGVDGLEREIGCRAELRELIVDLERLPKGQRDALLLVELGDFSHAEIAVAIGCPVKVVKALVFQARSALVAERDARNTPCAEIRRQLATARGGALRRGPLRRHLRQCVSCRAT